MSRGAIDYRLMQLRYCGRRLLYKVGAKEYLPEQSISKDAFNSFIRDGILSGRPFMVGRFGSQEARATAWSIGVSRGNDKSIPEYVQRRMEVGPGFFPADSDNIRRFDLLMASSAEQLDGLAYWDSFMQQWLLREICPSSVTVSYLENLEPYRNQDNPWMAALKRKRVLVVHPFARSIETQFAKRELLFSSPRVLPESELQTLVPPQTIAGARDGRFASWFEAFDWLCNEVDKRDFDVAIIGCGAYGFPLAAHVKEGGRQAIHGGRSRCSSVSKGDAGISSPFRGNFTTSTGSGQAPRRGRLMRRRLRAHVIGRVSLRKCAVYHG